MNDCVGGIHQGECLITAAPDGTMGESADTVERKDSEGGDVASRSALIWAANFATVR